MEGCLLAWSLSRSATGGFQLAWPSRDCPSKVLPASRPRTSIKQQRQLSALREPISTTTQDGRSKCFPLPIGMFMERRRTTWNPSERYRRPLPTVALFRLAPTATQMPSTNKAKKRHMRANTFRLPPSPLPAIHSSEARLGQSHHLAGPAWPDGRLAAGLQGAQRQCQAQGPAAVRTAHRGQLCRVPRPPQEPGRRRRDREALQGLQGPVLRCQPPDQGHRDLPGRGRQERRGDQAKGRPRAAGPEQDPYQHPGGPELRGAHRRTYPAPRPGAAVAVPGEGSIADSGRQDDVAAAEPSIDEKTSKLVSKGRWNVPGYKVYTRSSKHKRGRKLTTATGKIWRPLRAIDDMTAPFPLCTLAL